MVSKKIIMSVCVFRAHVVPGVYRLSDLRISPSPQLISLLRGRLPVSWTNEVNT